MSTSVSTIHPVPSGRLHIGDDGHANPDELVACIIDADARTGSSGLAYIAEHTNARILNEQARTTRALDNAEASLAEHGGTPEQFAVLDDIKRIIGAGHTSWCKPDDCDGTEHYGEANVLPVPDGEDVGVPHLLSSQLYVDNIYGQVHLWVATGNPNDDEMSFDGSQADAFLGSMQRWVDQARAQRAQLGGVEPAFVVPTEFDQAARVVTAGATGSILSAYVWTPDDHEPDAPTLLSVYSEPGHEDDLDLAGARAFRAQLAEFLPKLDAMIDVLAAAEQDGAQR